MKKFYIKNRFRIKSLQNGAYLYINTITDSRGFMRYSCVFDTYKDAFECLSLYCHVTGLDNSVFKIEPYAHGGRHEIEQPSQQASEILAKMRLFSGKGLKYNTHTPPKIENKYNPSKYYGRDVYMYQSLERNKGISLIHKLKDKRSSDGIGDNYTFERMNKLTNTGTIDLSYSIVDSIKQKVKSGKLTNRLQIKTYLKDRGFSCRQTNKLICKIFA